MVPRSLIVWLVAGVGAVAEDAPVTLPAALLPMAREMGENFGQGHFGRAEELLKAMLAREPRNVWVLSNLAVVRFRNGKVKEAEESARQALAVSPADGFSHRILGIILQAEGRIREASEHLGPTEETLPPAGDFLMPREHPQGAVN